MKYWMLLGMLGLVLNVGLKAGEADGATIVINGDGKTIKVEGGDGKEVKIEGIVTVEAAGDAAKDEKDKERRNARGRFFGNGGAIAPFVAGGRGWGQTFQNPMTTYNVSPRRQMADSLAWRFGEIIDAESRAKLDQLPYGVDRRQVVSVPVGGIDNPGAQWGNAIPVEEYFTLTPEQTKAVTDLREEYKTAHEKLAIEVFAQQREWAKKIAELRAGFEKRANDVLTGEDKAKKEELDKFMREINEKNMEAITKLLDEYKPAQPGQPGQPNQYFDSYRLAGERTEPNIIAAEKKLVDNVSATGRQKVEEVVKQQAEAREQMKKRYEQFQQGGDRDRGDRRKNDQQAVPPPKAPETTPDGF